MSVAAAQSQLTRGPTDPPPSRWPVSVEALDNGLGKQDALVGRLKAGPGTSIVRLWPSNSGPPSNEWPAPEGTTMMVVHARFLANAIHTA